MSNNIILQNEFFYAPATELAISLLGKMICRKNDDMTEKYRITETECYFGENDTACHASRGVTERTKIMYHRGGVVYVYLCYGKHNLLNIISGTEGHPESVLIRGITGANGPGKVTKLLNIDRSNNGCSLVSDDIWIEDDGFVAKYVTTKRVGIDYAMPIDRLRLWRFVMTNEIDG